MIKFAFVITKPLQLMVAISIIEELSDYISVDLHITNDFSEAEIISQRVSNYLKPEIKIIKNIFFHKTQTLAYKFLTSSKYSNIFIDSDVGFRRYIELIKIKIFNRGKNICVYEEGMGSYRRDIYIANSLYADLKIKIFRAFGVGVYFGGNFMISEIYLFSPQDYPISQNKRLTVKKIAFDLTHVLSKFEVLSKYIFSIPVQLTARFEKIPTSCVIYLSSWLVDHEFISKISNTAELFLVKLHPHIKEKINIESNAFYVDQSMPAEILLIEASKFCKRVIVYHHGSSVTRYVKRKNIEFIFIK